MWSTNSSNDILPALTKLQAPVGFLLFPEVYSLFFLCGPEAWGPLPKGDSEQNTTATTHPHPHLFLVVFNGDEATMDKGKAETRTDAAESAQESSSAQFDTLPLMYLPLPLLEKKLHSPRHPHDEAQMTQSINYFKLVLIGNVFSLRL